MRRFIELLKSLDSRLARIELTMTKPTLKEALVKTYYSCAEVAELSKRLALSPRRNSQSDWLAVTEEFPTRKSSAMAAGEFRAMPSCVS
jgi:hypothetical protein